MTERYCEGERFTGLSFAGEAFESCDFADCVFVDCSFSKCELDHTTLNECRFVRCEITGLRSVSSSVQSLDFEDCRLQEIVWAWWRLSVIGSLSYETMISSSIAQVLGYASSAEMLESATGRQFGVVMILMSVGMLSGFLILLPLGKKLCKSVDRSAAENGGSTWKNVLSGVFMLVMFSVYIPILLFTDNVQAAVMITGLVIAIGVGVLAKRPGLAWLNNFVMAFSMLGGLISSLAWVRIFG